MKKEFRFLGKQNPCQVLIIIVLQSAVVIKLFILGSQLNVSGSVQRRRSPCVSECSVMVKSMFLYLSK